MVLTMYEKRIGDFNIYGSGKDLGIEYKDSTIMALYKSSNYSLDPFWYPYNKDMVFEEIDNV
jgi:hypothetical protein